ncbi:MAG: hypothetical protein JXR37_14120, partial [Kiritimatiellae bacterium]|nr:hypothetical protein [Kiritimatiellia bacterium]
LDGPALRPGGITPKIDANGVVTFWDGVGLYAITARSSTIPCCQASMRLAVSAIELCAGSDRAGDCVHEPRREGEPNTLLIARRTARADILDDVATYYAGWCSKICLKAAAVDIPAEQLPAPQWAVSAKPGCSLGRFEGDGATDRLAAPGTDAVFAGPRPGGLAPAGLEPGEYAFVLKWGTLERSISVRVVSAEIEMLPQFLFANAGGDIPVRVRFAGLDGVGNGCVTLVKDNFCFGTVDVYLASDQSAPFNIDVEAFVPDSFYETETLQNGASSVYTFFLRQGCLRGDLIRAAVPSDITEDPRMEVLCQVYVEGATGDRITNDVKLKSDASNGFVFLSDKIRVVNMDCARQGWRTELMKKPGEKNFEWCKPDGNLWCRTPYPGFTNAKDGDAYLAEVSGVVGYDCENSTAVTMQLRLFDDHEKNSSSFDGGHKWKAMAGPYERGTYVAVSYGLVEARAAPSDYVLDTSRTRSDKQLNLEMYGAKYFDVIAESSAHTAAFSDHLDLVLIAGSLVSDGIGLGLGKSAPFSLAVVDAGISLASAYKYIVDQCSFVDNSVHVGLRTWVNKAGFKEQNSIEPDAKIKFKVEGGFLGDFRLSNTLKYRDPVDVGDTVKLLIQAVMSIHNESEPLFKESADVHAFLRFPSVAYAELSWE